MAAGFWLPGSGKGKVSGCFYVFASVSVSVSVSASFTLAPAAAATAEKKWPSPTVYGDIVETL